MNEFISNLLNELDEQLRFINLEIDEPIKRSEISIEIVLKAVEKLKIFVVKYKFRSQEEEINFFKIIKPKFLSKLICHNRIFNIETKKPHGGEKVVRKYLNNELDKLKRYFDNNLDFYRYFRTNSSYLDHKYFLRKKHDIKLSIDTFYFEADHRYSTSHDYKIAKIVAHDLVQVYLEDELANLDRKEPKEKSQAIQKLGLRWTASKVSLIEILYSFHSSGVFNNGKAELKEIAEFMETAMGVDLGQFHRTFLEIRIRKSGRTKFLDELKSNLIRRMDEADENL